MASDPESGPADSDSRAHSLFTQYIAGRETGQSIDFDAFCDQHPDDASALRKVRADWEWIQSVLQSAVGSIARESFAARLKAKCADDVESNVQHDSAREVNTTPGGAAADAIVKRLEEHLAARSRYKREAEIARGGMGSILRVWDEDLRRHLAMKVILGHEDSSRSGSSPNVELAHLARFLDEARVTGQLDHPGVVPVHELGIDSDGRVYFTMKLVKGRDLREIFDLVFEQKEGWNETRALGVILKACEAIAYAHDKGVIHRDVKPSNVMVGNFGEVFVMDWGLARVLDKEDRHDIRIRQPSMTALGPASAGALAERDDDLDSPIVTMDGDVIGTPAYMPPEQARGEVDKLGPRADVYGIGSMLYHLLARQMPYAPSQARMTNRAILARVLAGPPVALRNLNKEVPAELVAICEKAMARDPERRYPNTSALAEDLRAYLENRVVGAYEAGTWAETKKWVRRNKPLAASLAGAVLLLAAGLATSLIFKSRSDENAALAELHATETTAQAIIAEANATRAADQERIATQKANDVLSLSAIQELKELADESEQLWPARPAELPKYEAWLAKARLLVEGRASDTVSSGPAHPSLSDHETKLAEIRKRAKPLTREQVEADRRQSASFAAREKERAHLQWMRRMLGLEPWPSESDVEAELAQANLPLDADGLNALAWPLVNTDPATIVYGGEIKGLALAKRAVAIADETERPMDRDTLAWANFRVARFDKAQAEEQRAAAEIDAARKTEFDAYLDKLEQAIADWTGDRARTLRSQEASELASRVAALELDVNERRTYEFDDAQERWWHAQLAQLVSDLKAFTDERTGGLYSSGTSERYGWGIVKRAASARTIQERSTDGADAKRRWDEAVASIAKSGMYQGLALLPQMGLLPIGEDPDSHLWEFAHLETGEPAVRGADGRLVLAESTGVVLVLIPHGSFWMGAQSVDPTGRNYDPQALAEESPVHEVELSAYFISKYEMTQGQWERIAGRNPSLYGPLRYDKNWNRAGKSWSALHPVEQVSVNDCVQALARVGLVLPSEAQWENGARAGTGTPWWTGSDLASLNDAANLADAYGKSHGSGSLLIWEKDLDDGNTSHAEIGSYRANAFGLHDVIGNEWEWCADEFDAGFYGRSPRTDPVARSSTSTDRVTRGGSFLDVARFARTAYRARATPVVRLAGIGLRPAMALEPRASVSNR